MPAETVAHADVDTLRQLNRDYIRSVQTSDVRRFEEILAEDFLCSKSRRLAGRPRGLPRPDGAPGRDLESRGP